MSEVIYKIRVNRPCRLFIDDEEMMILDENKLTKITLPEGEYLRKVVAIDNKAIFDEAEITLSGASKLDNITLDTAGLEEAKRNALPKEQFQVGDLMYKALEDGSSVAVAKYVDKNITEVLIPEEIVYNHYIYEVKEIEDKAFYECSALDSVTIPNSVTWIGEQAFSRCSALTSITIPNSVTSIGLEAFWGCLGLTSITIPNSVTSIGDSAFSDCSGLTSIRVEDGNTKYDSRDDCNAIIETTTNTLIRGCQNTIIPNSVTSIRGFAFSGCSGLISVTIPNSVTSIGEFAFCECKDLTSIIIPNSVTSIEEVIFYGCKSLTSIIVQNGNPIFDSRNNCNAIIVTKTNTLFLGCQNTTIPNSVTSIGSSAFAGCSSLKSITIPNSITSIAGYVCEGAFWYCSSLTSITIPSSVMSIGYAVFDGCSGLTSLVVEKGNVMYDSRENCNAIIETATNTLIRGCENTIIPTSVTRIGHNAFNGCSGLTSLTIPNSVTSIGDEAFYKCKALTSITIPNSVTSIGEFAFCECKDLTSIIIPNSVTEIGDHAFRGCSSLTSVTISNSVTSIGYEAFPDHTRIIRK